jgi:hypothetical protein
MLEKINNAWYGAQNADKFKKMSQGEYEAHDKLHKELMPYGWYTSPLYDDKMYQNLIGHISSTTGHKHSKEAIDAIKKYRSVHNERKAADVESGANILPVALRYKNPMYHDFQGKSYRDQTYSDLMDEAKRKGHDALILKNTYDPGGSGGVDKMVDVGVVFHPHQIRSKFAAFHPDRGNESDLLAAQGGSIHMAGGGPAKKHNFVKHKHGEKVGGYDVGDKINNFGSYASSGIDDVEQGIHRVPMSAFEVTHPNKMFYAKNDIDHVHRLAEQIKQNKYMDPLLVAMDKKGAYVLEGSHRLGAAHLLGMKEIPAMIGHEADVYAT